MARYGKIYAGPVTEPLPQVVEAPAATALVPGSIVTLVAGTPAKLTNHAIAGGRGRFYVVQDNYLAQEGPDTAYAVNDTAIGMIPLDEQFFYVRVATGQTLVKGSPLVSNGAGALVLGATSGHHILFWSEEVYSNASGVTQLVLARVGQGTVV